MCQKGSSLGTGSRVPRELKEEGVEMGNCKCRCPSDPFLVPHVPSFCYNGTQASSDLCHRCTVESFLCRLLKKIRCARKREGRGISERTERERDLPNFPQTPKPLLVSPNLIVPILGVVTCGLNSCTVVHPPQGAEAWAEGLRVSEQVRPLC